MEGTSSHLDSSHLDSLKLRVKFFSCLVPRLENTVREDMMHLNEEDTVRCNT